MGRENSEPAIVGPSIALLQERFRQLQKVREKREERKLLDLFCCSDTNRIDSGESRNLFRQQTDKSAGSDSSDGMNCCMMPPPRFNFQDPLSLRLELNTKRSKNYRDIRTQPPIDLDLWFKTPHKLEISDVDTSLHL